MRPVSCLAVLFTAVLAAVARLGAVRRSFPGRYRCRWRAPSAAAGWLTAATQIDRRLFVAGTFTRLSPPTGSAVVVDLAGHYIPGAFPLFRRDRARDRRRQRRRMAGAWATSSASTAALSPASRASRPTGRWTSATASSPTARSRKVALAHGRIYLVGDFTDRQRRRAPRTGGARRRRPAASRGGAPASTRAAACGSCRSRRWASTSPAARIPVICGDSTRRPVACSSIDRASCRRSRHRRRSSTSVASGSSARCGR